MASLEIPGVGRVRQGRYHAELTHECSNFGIVHGGLSSALLAKAATFYLLDEHDIELPHTYTCHIEYLKPGRAGPIEFRTELVRKSSSMATVHVVAKQNSKSVVVGYFTNVDLRKAGGLSLPSGLKLLPTVQPAEVCKFENGYQSDWLPVHFPKISGSLMTSLEHNKWMVHKEGHADPSVADFWFAWKEPERFWTNDWLGFVCDQLPQIAENYRSMPNTGINGFIAYAKALNAGEINGKESPEWASTNWYVTHSLDLEVKRLLEPGKVRWLFCRAQAKEVVNGRQDVEVLVLDPDMNLIAVGHQIIIVKSLAWAMKDTRSSEGNASKGGSSSGSARSKI